MTDIPGWLTAGAKVGILSGRGVAETATVVRFTKTRVYLDRRREDWFPLKTLRVRVGGSTSYVVPTDDPSFQRDEDAAALGTAAIRDPWWIRLLSLRPSPPHPPGWGDPAARQAADAEARTEIQRRLREGK